MISYNLHLIAKKKWIFTSFFLISLGFFSSCNQTFEPLQKNDKYFFTIFGYLDVSADTQWVRIEPPREQLNATTEVPEMRVTLNNTETGETVIMKDSLFASGSGFNYINFYTLMDIDPEQTYLVKAEHPDGRTSQVTINTPQEFPTPRFLEEKFFFVDPRIHSIIINDVDNLIDVQTWWFVRITSPGRNEKKKFVFSYRNSARRVDAYGGAYFIDVNFDHEEETVIRNSNIPTYPDPKGEIEVLHRQVYVASAGPEWNKDIPSLDDLLYAQPEVLSNVENGLGYMVGVYSKIIPYRTCFEGERLVACEEEKPYW